MNQPQHSCLSRYVLALLAIILLPQPQHAQQPPPEIQWEKSLGGSGYDIANSIGRTSDSGYIVAGTNWSTDGDVTGNHGWFDSWIVKLTKSGLIQWQKSLGGSGNDAANSIQQTSDGGYIVAGSSYSNDGDVTGHHGASDKSDYWIVKLTGAGVIQWQKSLGGIGNDWAYSIEQTSDGGYIVAGYSASTDGDVSGHHGSFGSEDYWIVKLTNAGVVQWQKSFGGIGNDRANSIQQTSDGGFIIAGNSQSTDGDVTGHHGVSDSTDSWIVKLTSAGVIQWQKSLGGSNGDEANSIEQTSDGGYIVAGISKSNDGHVTDHHGASDKPDSWIVKLTGAGVIQWQKSLGGSGDDMAYSIEQTSDGGYIVAGLSKSNDGDVTGHHGASDRSDSWIVKLTGAGLIQWEKSLGGSGDDVAKSIEQTSDGEYIVAGISESTDGDVTGNHGGFDFWTVKLIPGIIQWQKTLGGIGDDYANSIEQTSDGGYIVAGLSKSNDGDVTGHHGTSDKFDYWIVKLTNAGVIQWQKSFGGSGDDYANSIEQTSDGGYIVAGSSRSNDGDVTGHHGSSYISDSWIVKLTNAGVIEWQKSLGGSGDDGASSIEQTSDGGYIVAGYNCSTDGDVTGHHGTSDKFDSWIVKLTNAGVIQWEKSFGESEDDWATSIEQTSDGGYIVAGKITHLIDSIYQQPKSWVAKLTDAGVIQWEGDLGASGVPTSIQQTSDGGYIVASNTLSHVGGGVYASNYQITKLTSTGLLGWQKEFGGSDGDYATPIEQTSDGGCIVAGGSYSTDGDVTGHHGASDSSDYWIVKLTNTGMIQWQKSLGGSGEDGAKSIQQTSDGGYIVAGYSASTDGDVTGNHGANDFWVVKISPDSSAPAPAPGKFTNLLLQGVGANGVIGTNYPTSFVWSATKEISGTKTIELSEDNGQTWKPTPAATATGSVTSVNYTTPGYAIPQALFRIYSATDKSDMYTMATPIAIVATSAVDDATSSPGTITLGPNHPNPFSSTTQINFTVLERGFVRLSIQNELGVEVACLVSEELEAGEHSVKFSPQELASGLYLYRLTSGQTTKVGKMSVVK